MNLSILFNVQKELDDRILMEKGLTGVDLLPKKILSLQVELGELANELPEVFKFWSKKKNNYEKALVEYCDCLHFILSIGNNLAVDIERFTILPFKNKTILKQFLQTYCAISDLKQYLCDIDLIRVLEHFVALGEMLGFTWEQIEKSYYAKNKINHQRQTDHY